MTHKQNFEAINAQLEIYFEGLYQADSKMLSTVFHPDAKYINMVEGEYINDTMPDYFKVVDQRTPPAAEGQVRKDEILSIEFGDDKMAFVKVRLTMYGRDYLDFLTFTNDAFGWRIMSKVFFYVPSRA